MPAPQPYLRKEGALRTLITLLTLAAALISLWLNVAPSQFSPPLITLHLRPKTA